MFLHLFFKNIIFRFVAIVTQIVMGYFSFFTQTGLFNALYHSIALRKKNYFTKNPLNFYSFKVTKFYGDSVKNESVMTHKLERGGGKKTPPPSLFRV